MRARWWAAGLQTSLCSTLFVVTFGVDITNAVEESTADNKGSSTMLPAISVETSRPKSHPKTTAQRNTRSSSSAQRNTRPSSSSPVVAQQGATGSSENRSIASGPAAPQTMASQITIAGADLRSRPVARPGEVLEAVPGLIVTQHSGEGKANQYFLRGYNLDHGTDMAIWVDDVPVNMRTHAHGQGYADLNWLMPETIKAIDVHKGPYFAEDGDFGSAGSLRIGLIDSVPKAIAQITAGSFGYSRFFGMNASKAGDGTLLVAGETGTYDGPWSNPDDARKVNGLLRYSQGTALEGTNNHRDGLFKQVEFDGPSAAARNHFRPDRALRFGKPH